MIIKRAKCLLLMMAVGAETASAYAFFRRGSSSGTALWAKPQRLGDNAEGVVYVNDRCINCAACSGFAPQVFQRSGGYHVVHHQPDTQQELLKARAALAACPVAAIRLETKAERRHRANTDDKAAVEQAWSELDETTVRLVSLSSKLSGFGSPFPRPFLLDEVVDTQPIGDVYWVGHHNEASFGSIPYLAKAKHSCGEVWVLVDTPKYSARAVDDVVSLTGEDGPDFMLLTHVDDTPDHDLWAERFDGLKRIFHAGDLGRNNWRGDNTLADVDILLETVEANSGDALTAYSLDGDVLRSDWKDAFESGELGSDFVILHTPGHSPGSITLYKRSSGNKNDSPGILFTGDTYAYTTVGGGKMTGFGRYGRNLRQQANTLSELLKLKDWSVIAPGHGHPRDYRGEDDAVKDAEMKEAQADLLALSGRNR